MRFPADSETVLGRALELIEPLLHVRERGHVLEPLVGEGRPVVSLAWSAPADLAVQTVVVVVARKALERHFCVSERSEDLAVEHLAFERRPERLDLAVRPRRVDLGADLADLELAQCLAEAVEQPGHPVRELDAVVGHEVDRPAAQLDAAAQPRKDRRDLPAGGHMQSEHVAGVVVDQAVDPRLQVAVALELNEERAFDVDVPKRVHAGALVARTACARTRRTARAAAVEELLDPGVSDLRDAASAQLGRDALGVPVRLQPHRDHDLLDPARMRCARRARATRLRQERLQPAALMGTDPAPERRAAADLERQRRIQPLFARHAQQLRASSRDRQHAPRLASKRWAPAAGCQEAKARTFLERVSKPTTRGIAELVLVMCPYLVHRRDASRVSKTGGNLT